MVFSTFLLGDDSTTNQDYLSISIWRTFMPRLFPASLCWALLVPRPSLPLMNLWPHSQVDIKNQGKTALQVAAHQGHMEVVKALLQANSSIEVKDEDGDTALHYAAFGWGHPPHTHTQSDWFPNKMHLCSLWLQIQMYSRAPACLFQHLLKS